MASPLNAMELVQSWNLTQAKIAAAQQEMQMAAMLAPYRVEALQSNALRDRAAIDHQRNALAFQREQGMQRNALAREALGMKERMGQNSLMARERALTARGGAREKAPAGYRMLPNGNMEAIPGGPADTKAEGMFNQDLSTLRQGESSLDRLGGAASALMKHEGLKGITGLRGAIPNMPGSSAADAAAKLQTLKAQIGFSVLQEMRNASKTGGALGAVTERELGFLQNALDALDQAQSMEQFTESLGAIKNWSEEGKGRLQEAFNVKHRKRVGTESPQAASGPRVGTVEDGYRFKGGNPADQNSWEKVGK